MKRSLATQYSIKRAGSHSIWDILSYILANITQKRDILNIASLSKRFSINQSQLKKIFRQVYKTSIRQFIIEERMKIARKALLENNQTVSNIALMTGYADLSNFSRDFKKYTGYSPKQFQFKFSGIKVGLVRL